MNYYMSTCWGFSEVAYELRHGDRTRLDVQLANARMACDADAYAAIMVPRVVREPKTTYVVEDALGTLVAVGINRDYLARRYPGTTIVSVLPTRYARRTYAAYGRALAGFVAQWEFWSASGMLDPARGFTLADVTVFISDGERSYFAYWHGNAIGHLYVWPDDRDFYDYRPFSAHVIEPFRRRGVATMMYDAAERKLAERRRRLMPGVAQSADAKAFWQARRQWRASSSALSARANSARVQRLGGAITQP